MSTIRVAIADDHAVVRQGLRTFLELQDDMEVVGEAEDGEAAVATMLVEQLAAEDAAGGAGGAGADRADHAHLTPRELEVLAELVRGRANKAIAFELGVSERTVKTHVSNILGKLGFTDRTQAAVYAVEHGLVGRKD